MLFWLWLGAILATEAVVELIVASEILFGVRDWVSQRSVFFGKLINCGYCASVWVAALLFSYYLPAGEYLDTKCLFNKLLWVIVLVGKAAIVHRLSNVIHERFSRLFNKHRFGVELVHTHVGDSRS